MQGTRKTGGKALPEEIAVEFIHYPP